MSKDFESTSPTEKGLFDTATTEEAGPQCNSVIINLEAQRAAQEQMTQEELSRVSVLTRVNLFTC